jgi:acetyl esterase/lipase
MENVIETTKQGLEDEDHMPKIRSIVTTSLGAVSTGMGLLIVLPGFNGRLWKAQLVINELPWLPALLGGTATVLGAWTRPRPVSAVMLGAVGAGLALKPFLSVSRTMTNMEQAMRDALGEHYEQCIPAEMHQRVAKARWSLMNTVGGRRRVAKAKVTLDVAYRKTPSRPLKLDVYEPLVKPAVGDRYPAIIVVHGGSWQRGDKKDFFDMHRRYLANQGYVVFSIQYRLSSEAKWPAQMEDIQDAIRWVKRHADEYKVDPSRVALLGRSSGGHLALLAAYRPDQPDEDHVDTSVRAIVAMYPPTDLRMWPSLPNTALTDFLGGSTREIPHVYSDASPIEFVGDNLPPTLILQGYMDNLVFPAHAEALHNRLAATNTPAAVLRVPWGRHGFDALMSGLGAQLSQYHMDRFLAWSLYRKVPND